MNFTRQQHLEMIKVIAESVGGKMRFIDNTTPAFKKDGGKWHRIEYDETVDAFKAAKILGVKITELPTSSDRLGSIAKIKDHNKAVLILKKEMSQKDVYLLSPKQISSKIKKSLSDSGMIEPSHRFLENLTNAIKKTKMPLAIISNLSITNSNMVWADHHLRMSKTDRSPEELIERNDGVFILKDKKLLIDAMKAAANKHYMRPELFVLEINAALYQENIALAFSGEPADIEKETPATRIYLKEVLKNYATDGPLAFDIASKEFDLINAPFKIKNESISWVNGVALLRRVLSENKKNETNKFPTPTTKKTNKNKYNLASNLSQRKRIWEFRGVINDLISKSNEVSASVLNEKWVSLMGQGNISFKTSFDDMENTIARIENVYGPLIKKHTLLNMNSMSAKIDMMTQDSPEVKNSISEVLDNISSTNHSIVDNYKISLAVADVFTNEFIIDATSNFKNRGVIPDLSKLHSDVTYSKFKKFNYNEAPENADSEIKLKF